MNDRLVLGKIYVGDGENVLFITYMNGIVRVSEIIILTVDNQMKLLIGDKNSDNIDKLNFHPEHQIEATYRLRKDCEKTIYFTDNYNVPRYFILSRAHDFSKLKKSNTAHRNYAVSNKFMLARMYNGLKDPRFYEVDVIEGGSLQSGSYNIAVQYLDADYNPTEWISTSETIIIYKDNQNNNFTRIRGSNNNELEHQNFGKTNKSILVKLTNLDRNYVYIRIALICARAGTGLVDKCYATREIMIPELQDNPPPYDIEYLITETSLVTDLTEQEILAFTTPIHKAKTIEQIDNILVMANTKDRQVDWCKLQQFASKIQSIGIRRTIPINDGSSGATVGGTTVKINCYYDYNLKKIIYYEQEVPTGTVYIPDGYADGMYMNDFKRATCNLGITGYMPGETYSFGIVYVFEDGFHSPVYHIPCNPKNPKLNSDEFKMEIVTCANGYYPRVKCEPNYWGNYYEKDADGNYTKFTKITTNTKIRHHRFPLRDKTFPLVKQSSGTLEMITKRRYYFYIQFRRRAKPCIKANETTLPSNINGTNALADANLYNIINFKKRLYRNGQTKYLTINTKRRPGDLSRGAMLSYTGYNRFKKNFETISLIIHLTWWNTETSKYEHESIDYEVEANNELRPTGNKNIGDTWGVKYEVPQRDMNYELKQVIIVEIPQVPLTDSDLMSDDEGEGEKEVWITTGSKFKWIRTCLDEEQVALSEDKKSNSIENHKYATYCLDYLRFSFASPYDTDYINLLGNTGKYKSGARFLTNFRGNYKNSEGDEIDEENSEYNIATEHYIYADDSEYVNNDSSYLMDSTVISLTESANGTQVKERGKGSIPYVSGVSMSGRTRRIIRWREGSKYKEKIRIAHLISYINPLPIIYRVDYNDVRDTRMFTADVMGIQFSNIEMPSMDSYVIKDPTNTNPEHNKIGNKIVGYKIVRSPRDEENTTILDSGVLTPVVQEKADVNQSNYMSSALMFPLLTTNTGKPQLAFNKINNSVFGVIHPRSKFLGDKITDDTQIIIEGRFVAEDKVSPYIESFKQQELWITKDVQAGSSYDPKNDKKKEQDDDGWQLNLFNKHIFLGYEAFNPTTVTINNTLVYLDALTFKDTILKYSEDKKMPLYNMSSDNRITLISLSTEKKTEKPISDNIRFSPNLTVTKQEEYSLPEGTTIKVTAYPYVKFKKRVDNPYLNFMYLPYYAEQQILSPFPQVPTPPLQTSAHIFNGDSYIVPMKYRNTLFYNNHARKRKKKDGIWQMIVGGLMTVGGAVMTAYGIPGGTKLVAGGISSANSGIKLQIAAQIYAGMHDNGLVNTLDDIWSDDNFKRVNPPDDEIQWISECMDSFFFETNVNINWRNGFTGIHPDFEDPLVGYSLNSTKSYLLDKLTVPDLSKNNSRLYLGYSQAEIYQMNKDYLRRNEQKKYFMLSQHYDCCSECKEQHPLRLAYSQQSFQEERIDNYMVFLPNNYSDCPGERGVVTKICTMYNNMVVLTTEGLWNYPKNQQERVTGQIMSFIGTGNYFSIPARALIEDDSGRSAGCDSQWAVIKTPFGIIYPSIGETNIYNYEPPNSAKNFQQQRGLRCISDSGMEQWFNEHLALAYNDDNPSHPLKNGFVACYDDIKNRYILTKKDPVVVNGQLEDDGWTMGYNLQGSDKEPGMWISFYSYIPNIYISAPNRMMSWKASYNKPTESIKIWEHNIKGSYQTFYGTYYPYIVEYVGKSEQMETTLWDNIQINTTARRWVDKYISNGKTIYTNDFVDERFVTFNRAIFYNSRQCTNIKTLKPKEDFNNDQTQFFNQYVDSFEDKDLIVLDKKEKDWTLNNLRDAVTKHNYPIWINGIESIRKTNLEMFDRLPGYIDKTLNQDVFGPKIWYDEEPLRDKFLVQRYVLFDANKSNIQLTINYSIDNKTVSYE
jgi:hypothetical protein